MIPAPFSSRVGKDRKPYEMESGVLIPSVTTILNKETPGELLAESAANLTKKGIIYWKHWNWLAEIGTLSHSMVHCHLMDLEVRVKSFSQEQIDIAENCFLSFLSWLGYHDLEVISCEQAMISKVYGFGGRPDIIGILDAIPSILDIKTGPRIYFNQWYQLAAYKILTEENHSIRIRKLGILDLGRDESEKYIEGYLPSRKHPNFELHEMYFIQQLKAFKIEEKILARD